MSVLSESLIYLCKIVIISPVFKSKLYNKEFYTRWYEVILHIFHIISGLTYKLETVKVRLSTNYSNYFGISEWKLTHKYECLS